MIPMKSLSRGALREAGGRSAARLLAAFGLLLLTGCTLAEPPGGYETPGLDEVHDPMVPARDFAPWRPPRQLAAFVHPYEDPVQGIYIGGHWILVLLGEGSFGPGGAPPERDPVPDQELAPGDLGRLSAGILVPPGTAIPYRGKEASRP
jgi:hypothetical protein